MSGWRKRQVMDMAREAGFERLGHMDNDWVCLPEDIEAFAELVRADERGKFLGVLRQLHDFYSLASNTSKLKEKNA